MAYLFFEAADGSMIRRELTGSLTIGRSLSCDLWIDDRRMSREHCRIERDDQHWLVRDLKSTNGTAIRHHLIERHTLKDGDVIIAGRTRLIFREGEMPPERPADPYESQPQRRSSPAHPGDTLADSAIHRRAAPRAHVENPREASNNSPPATPLPFSRPPATPIVRDQSGHEHGKSKGWFETLLEKFRRK